MNILCINMFADSFDTVEPDFLEQLENLAAAVDTTKCAVVIFNGTENTAQVMEKIQMVTASAGLSKISNMAIVQHTSNILYMGSARIDVNTDIEDDEWNAQPVFNLFTQLCSKYEIDNIDILACSMLPLWAATFEAMEVELRNNLGKNINIRASDDDTGNLKSGGDWIQESDNVNIADLYFNTDKLAAYTGVLGSSQNYAYGKWNQMYQPFFKNGASLTEVGVYGNSGAFAALKNDGTIVLKGNNYGGPTSGKAKADSETMGPIKTIFTGMYMMVALNEDNKIYSWGYGPFCPPDGTPDVKRVFPSSHSVAVLFNDNSVQCYALAANLNKTGSSNALLDVKMVYTGLNIFAAHHINNDLTVWRDGTLTSKPTSVFIGDKLTDVKRIFMAEYVGLALKTNNNLVTFGEAGRAELDIPLALQTNTKPIKMVQTTMSAFAVLYTDGTVDVWGTASQGGSIATSQTSYLGTAFTNIKYIASTETAFAALHNNGRVTIWGDSAAGGQFNNGVTATAGGNQAKDIKMIYNNNNQFVAVQNGSTTDNFIKTWGGGTQGGVMPDPQTGLVKTVFSNGYRSFHYININGDYRYWNNSTFYGRTGESDAVSATFNRFDITTIRQDGTVWHSVAAAQDSEWTEANLGVGDLNSKLYYDTAYKNLDCLTLKEVFVTGSKLSSLENSSLVGTDLTDMDLTGINMSGADVTGAIFTGATLTGVTGTLIGVPAALPNGVTIVNNQFVVSGSTTTAPTATEAEATSVALNILPADRVKFATVVTSPALGGDVKIALKNMITTAFGSGTSGEKTLMRKQRKAALNQILANATVDKIKMTFSDLFASDNPLYGARSSNEVTVYRLGEKILRDDTEDDIYIPLTEDTDVNWETIGAGEVKISRGSDVGTEERYTLEVTGTPLAAIEQYGSSAAGYFADPQTRTYFIQDDIVTIGGKTVRFGGSHIGGGGSGGDPYVFPLCSNIPVKLPNRDETYRMFEQGNNYVNAHVSKATAEHQSRMIKFVKKYTDKVDNVITDGYFYDKFFISAEGHKLMFDLENKKIKGNNDTLRFFKITTSNAKFSNQCFNERCYKVHIEWDTNEGHTIATNIMFFENPNIENGISMEMSSIHDSVGMLIRNYRPKLMRLPSLFTEKYNKLHKALAKSKSKYQNKTIEEPGEGWWPRDAVKHASLR